MLLSAFSDCWLEKISSVRGSLVLSPYAVSSICGSSQALNTESDLSVDLNRDLDFRQMNLPEDVEGFRRVVVTVCRLIAHCSKIIRSLAGDFRLLDCR